jgi:hypothetical protein
VRQIEHTVRRIAGVRDVENLLHRSDVPAPQGRPHRHDPTHHPAA